MRAATKWIEQGINFTWKWSGEMSGAISIPLAIAGVSSQKTYYFVLAYCALWVVILRKTFQQTQDLAAQSRSHAKEISKLGSEIESLRSQLDDRKNRLSVINKLGEFRWELKNRARQINEMGAKDWDKQSHAHNDPKAMAMFGEMQHFFQNNPDELGGNAWLDVTSTENMDRSNIPCMDIHTIQYAPWAFAQHLLNHMEKNIAAIVIRLRSRGE